MSILHQMMSVFQTIPSSKMDLTGIVFPTFIDTSSVVFNIVPPLQNKKNSTYLRVKLHNL